jgi:competence protein ComGF
MLFLNDKRGFTLLEVLISFSIVLVITSFFPVLIKNLYQLTEKKNGISPLELDIFIQQTKMEVRNAKRTTSNGSVLTIVNRSDQQVTYAIYQNKIRRRVDGTGQELMLHHVHELSFSEVKNGFICRLKGRNGEAYEFRVSAIYKEWNQN